MKHSWLLIVYSLLIFFVPHLATAGNEEIYTGMSGTIRVRSFSPGEGKEEISRVFVDGKEVFKTDSRIFSSAFFPGDPDVYIFAEHSGGNACAGLYRVISMRSEKPAFVSKQFGNCNAPDITMGSNNAKIEFPPSSTRPGLSCHFDHLRNFKDCK